jgi:hypothetical protein
MLPLQFLLAIAVNVALCAALAGLIARERAGQCWSFVVYLCGMLTCESLVLLWPRTFYVQDFWMIKQALYDVLKTAVALELAWQVVRAFPGALRTARRSALVLLAGAVLLLGLGRHTAHYEIIFLWQPRVVACTALLFSLTALLVAWYHLPIRALHRAILGGFAVYLAFFVTLLHLFARWGWDGRVPLGLLDAAAYLTLSVYWARAAWVRTEEAMPSVTQPGAVLVERPA